MTTLALPADTVQFYNDGPDFPATPLLLEAERAYRDGFNTAANAAGSWRRPVYDLVETCRRSRRDARAKAEVRVPSSELFRRPDMDSEQIVYRAGHEVAASRARGKAHGFEFAVQCWEALAEEGVRDEVNAPPGWKCAWRTRRACHRYLDEGGVLVTPTGTVAGMSRVYLLYMSGI